MSTIRERVDEARRARGMSLRRLGSIAQVSDSTLRGIGAGKETPRLGTISRIATALDADPRWLAFGDPAAGENAGG